MVLCRLLELSPGTGLGFLRHHDQRHNIHTNGSDSCPPLSFMPSCSVSLRVALHEGVQCPQAAVVPVSKAGDARKSSISCEHRRCHILVSKDKRAGFYQLVSLQLTVEAGLEAGILQPRISIATAGLAVAVPAMKAPKETDAPKVGQLHVV